ncbi:MAG: GAF domain-containing protein [Calditrichaceae bacterium]
MYKLIGLYLLIVIGIFIEFSFLGSVGNILIKIIITAGISYLLYDYWTAEQDSQEQIEESEIEPETKSVVQEEKKPLFFDISSTRFTDLIDQDANYKDFIENQFMVVWDFIFPKNGFIIYRNAQDKMKIIHENLQPDILLDTGKYPTSLFTLIENKEGILIENKIEQTLNLIPFYKNSDYKPQSVLAFMIELESGEKLYWIFDSDITENFNTDDTTTIERIIQNITAITFEALKSFELNNTCLYLDNKYQIAEKLNTAKNPDECLEYFCEFLIKNFEASKLTIGMKKATDTQTAVIKKAIGIDDPYKNGYEFPLEEGLNGFVIMKNKPHLIEDIEKGEYFVPRFSKDEKTNYGIRSFLSVPIEVNSNAIGMITLEHKLEQKYTLDDKKNLLNYSKILASALYRFAKTKIH